VASWTIKRKREEEQNKTKQKNLWFDISFFLFFFLASRRDKTEEW